VKSARHAHGLEVIYGEGAVATRCTFRLRTFVLGLSLFAFALPACAPAVSVGYAYDRRVRFGEFRTFAMAVPNRAVPTASAALDPFVMQRLRQLTYFGLKKKGLIPADTIETADVVVHVLAIEDTRTEVYSYGGPRYYGGPYWSAWGSPMVSTRTYKEAKLVVDLVNRKENAVVWRGTGERIWDETPPDEELVTFVDRILENYPPSSEPR
jgi:hypothetical protein